MSPSMKHVWELRMEMSDQKRPLSEPDAPAERPALGQLYFLN